MDKLIALFNLFRKGYVVANPTAWKTGQITLGIISAVLVSTIALAKTFGYELQLSEDQIASVAGIIIAINGLFNPIATVISSDKVGVSAPSESASNKAANLLGGK